MRDCRHAPLDKHNKCTTTPHALSAAMEGAKNLRRCCQGCASPASLSSAAHMDSSSGCAMTNITAVPGVKHSAATPYSVSSSKTKHAFRCAPRATLCALRAPAVTISQHAAATQALSAYATHGAIAQDDAQVLTPASTSCAHSATWRIQGGTQCCSMPVKLSTSADENARGA